MKKIQTSIAHLHATTKLLSVGVLHHAKLGDIPAYHTYNSIYQQDWIWAYSGRRKGKIFLENHLPDGAYTAQDYNFVPTLPANRTKSNRHFKSDFRK